jgi:hypothetical protein
MKTRTAAALVTDHKRKTVAACVPDLHVTDGINYTTELHATPRMRPVLEGLISESEKASALTSLSAGALSPTLHSRDRWSQRNLRLKETNQGYPTVDIWAWNQHFFAFSPISTRCRMACARVSFLSLDEAIQASIAASSAGTLSGDGNRGCTIRSIPPSPPVNPAGF